MSGPFRFQQEETRSPLDRSASPFSAGQPVSFKTNVNRAKTKKWVQAKKNAYDGDDWGEYDEYDEYGVNQDPEPPAAQRSYGQQQSRSFTEPFQQAPLTRGRRNSFEQGEEQRAFSSSIPYPQQGYAQQHQQQTEGDDYGEGHDPLDKRNFASSTTPHPLQTRISQVPAGFTPPITTQFPPRKSSIGQRDSPSAASPPPRNDSQPDKPLPFIRPADIYKRHQDEQERASLEASRPSLDEIASQAEGAKSLQPMDTVTERKSEYLPDFDAAFSLRDKQSSQQADSSAAQSDDLRSVVDQAFTRTDDQRSVPPTPISNDSGSDLLRSNTGSTSGISPIMSRVPSSATSALKNRNQAGGEGSTPAIAEEPSETVTPVSQPTTAAIVEPLHQVPRKPSPGHSRNFSSSSTPRSGLATPTRGDSPARSPILAPHRDLPEPKSALFTTDSNESSEGMEGGLKGPSSAYSAREADIATAMANSPTNGAPELSAAELQSQNTFLESHNAQYSVDDALPRDRSESPSKGRVQALAGKFGDVASSRRGSTQSNLSRNSVQSWEKSRDNSRAASPTKASPGKPSSPAKEFRPHLPGQWESYATTAMTPSEHGEQDRGMSVANNATNPLEKTDLTPTTAKRSVAEGPVSDEDNTDPIAALRDAGAAMVHSIRTTVGLDDDSYEQQQQQQQQRSPVDHGDVYHPRPLQLDRTISSISSMPPTPPAKDTPASEIAPPAPLKEKALQPLNVTKQLKRPSLDPQLSTDPSAEDQESDRLRKEIVASLTPVRSFESPAIEPNRSSLLPSSPGANRASSILPSEYDTYWAEEDRESPRPSQDTERNTTGHVKTVTFLPQTDEPSKPVILHRFSWEESNSQLQTPDEHAQPVSEVDPIKTPQADKFPSPAVEPAAKEERNPWSEGLSDSYFGPSRTITVTKPESAAEPQLDMRPSTPPPDPTRAMVSPSRERSRSPGLHVVNTELDPEAVDLPPRFSAEHEPPLSKEPSLTEKQPTEPKESHPATSPVSEVPKTPITHEPSEHSPTTDKPLGAREIATLNSSSERIATYNKTRDYWATADHGLQDWLSSSIEANPDLATPIAVAQRPTTGSVRHRHTGSLALFGKLAGSSSHDHGAEQHNSASTPVAAPTSANSPTTGAPSGSGFGGRIANQQMQLKGKDLLHTANVLSGKGMTSAKGFFAKGKSRFGREKASPNTIRTDSPASSREASEEPEMTTRRSRASTRVAATPETQTPERRLSRSATTKGKENESPSEDKRKRRFSFSSQLRRLSRSRSRPNSVALPSNPPSVFESTPKSTPPRELHQFLMGERRSHSFHAPDSWTAVPPAALNEYFNTTPPRRDSSQSRIGILPSPAKSAFSSHDQAVEQDVPPVPPIPSIPDEVAVKHYRRRFSQESASHRTSQSIIRDSTPPTTAKRHSMPPVISGPDTKAYNPVFTENDTESSAQGIADSYKDLLRASEGSFQPDLPTAESADLRHDQFHFGFADQGERKFENEEDEDQPPQLNHEPFSGYPKSHQVAPFMPASQHMDVSDEDSEEKHSEVKGVSSSLPAPSTNQKVDDVSPLLPPVELSSDDLLNNRDEFHTTQQNEGSLEAKVFSVGDTPFVLERRRTDDVTKPGEPFEEVAMQIKQGEQSTRADNPVQNEILNIEGPAQTSRRPAIETEKVGNGNMSSILTGLDKLEDDDTRTKAEKTDTRAFSPVWFAKSDLQLSKSRLQSLKGLQGGSVGHAQTPVKGPNDNAHIPHNPGSRPMSEIARPNQQPGATRDGDDSLSPGHAGANADIASQTRLAAPPLQIVHTAKEYGAFDPSRTLWNDDIAAADPYIIAGKPGEMKDENDHVMPVAQVPRITEHGPQINKAEEPHDDGSRGLTSNGYFRGHANLPGSHSQGQQLQVSKSDTAAPERSRSILSQISAMASEEGHPYSPASTGRSTPSTIRRMQPEPASKASMNQAQIPEETVTTDSHSMQSDKDDDDDDYDLYADHNGIVKDVRDENGQPLRLADTQVPGSTQHLQPTKLAAPNYGVAPGSRDGEVPRYSIERPMSFISGPTDQDGMPQDQINQLAHSRNTQGPQIPENRGQTQQPRLLPVGTQHFAESPAHIDRPAQTDQQHQSSLVPGPSPSKNILQAVKSINPSNTVAHAMATSPHPPFEGSTPSSKTAQMPTANRQGPGSVNVSNLSPQDPRIYSTIPRQPIVQGAQNQPPIVRPDHDPRGHIHGQEPRNQYDFHQQMMQQRGSYPQIQGAENKNFTGSSPPPSQQTQKPEKSSSKPRLSSVFKTFGGKAYPNSQQQPKTNDATVNSSLKPPPVDPSRNSSFQSAVSRISLSRETSAGRPNEQPSSYVPPNHPPGMAQQLHPPQNNHNAARLQPADPRLELSKPASPTPQRPPPTGQSQPDRISASTTPEGGKKKRFSAFGALFGRSNKDEKKAQKLQRNSAPAPAQTTAQTPVQTPTPQKLPPQQQYRPQQSGLAYYPPGKLPEHTVQNVPMGPQYASPQNMQPMLPRNADSVQSPRPPQQYQQPQQGYTSRTSMSDTRPPPGSAFLGTKQLAEEHRLRQNNVQSPQAGMPYSAIGTQSRNALPNHVSSEYRHINGDAPLGGYYKPDTKSSVSDQGAYAASLSARPRAEQHKQHEPLREQGSYDASQAQKLHTQYRGQQPGREQGTQRGPRFEQQHMQERESLENNFQQQQQREWHPSQQHRQQQHPSQQSSSPQQPLNNRNVSGQAPHTPSAEDNYISQGHINPPVMEPTYEAPPIPAAYDHVTGAFISPLDRQQPTIPPQQDLTVRPSPVQQYSDSRMQSISPQVSAQSQYPSKDRSHSDANSIPIVSPISNSPDLPSSSPPGERTQKTRMSSISEIQQHERPWHLNFPQGATEQEIVRARQKQYMEEHFNAQQQSQAERAARSPSPRIAASRAPTEGGGFRELLPRNSSQIYPSSQQEPQAVSRNGVPVQPTPIHPDTPPAAYPLPMSPDSTRIQSPINPMAGEIPPPPPPKIPHSPMRSSFSENISNPTQEQQTSRNSQHFDHSSPQYDEHISEESPPSYDGTGVPNNGMVKSRPEVPRLSNINTDIDADTRGRDPRSRQTSVEDLQQPQPASMAASPQRLTADMGADALRLQLLQQEDFARMERVQRVQQQQAQRALSDRELQEREAARARARELERIASVGGQVSSLRRVGGSPNGRAPGWERPGSSSRPVFELPAVEDDAYEPAMKATSYPGQEWVPPMWDGTD